MDGMAALECSYEQLAKVVGGITSGQLTGPTPCTAWDTRTLLNHLFGACWMFTLVNQGDVVGEDAGDVVGDNPAQALCEVSVANLASWSSAGAMDGDRTYSFGTFPAAAGLMINVGEVAVHLWDLATATGQPFEIIPDVAQAIFDFYTPLPLNSYREGGVFGPEITVPAGASAADRLLGLLGRRPARSPLRG
jgi:uncharacterized protein (TIGR03086 family)